MKISMCSKYFSEVFTKTVTPFLILGFMSFLPFSVSGKMNVEEAKKCELYGGTVRMVDALTQRCIFPQPTWYCLGYVNRPVLIQARGLKVCSARATCQKEICQWQNGKRTPRCNKVHVQQFTAHLACPAFKGQCPNDPTICANTKNVTVDTKIKLFDIRR